MRSALQKVNLSVLQNTAEFTTRYGVHLLWLNLLERKLLPGNPEGPGRW